MSGKRESTVYLLVSGMTSSSIKLDLMFLRPFWCSKKAFCNRFWQEKDLTENLEAIWTISFKIRVKIEIQECLSLSRQVCFRCKFCVSEVHFNLAFYHQKLSRMFLWIHVTLMQNHNKLGTSPPMDQLRLVSALYIDPELNLQPNLVGFFPFLRPKKCFAKHM